MNSSYQFFTLTAILLVLIWIVNTLKVRFRTDLRQLPGPRLATFSRLWNIKTAASGDAHKIFQELHQKYGKVVRTGPNHVAIADPAMIPVIYGTKNTFLKTSNISSVVSDQDQTDFYESFSTPYAGEQMHSMFSTPDPVQHKSLKQAVANKYSLSSMKGFEPHLNECNDMFAYVLSEYANSNHVIDLGVWLQWYAFDVIGAITFNRTFGFMEERRDIHGIIAGIEGGLWYGGICGQVPELHSWLLGNDLLMKFLSKIIPAVDTANPVPKVVKMVEEAIQDYDRRELSEPDRVDFLSLFRKEGKKSPDKMPHRDLINHLMNNLLAGSDTTAISLRAVFYYLIKNPKPYKKLVDEIQLADHEGRASNNITWEECYQMPYLQACIKEAMRLHPGVGFPLERFVPKEGLKVDDFFLPEGTIVGMNAWVINYDKGIFGDDVGDFRPERWIEASMEELKTMEKCFFSFGAGTRTCIGKNISLMEMGKVVPQILRDFDVSWASDAENWYIKTFWFAKQSRLLVRFHPRAKEEVSFRQQAVIGSQQ